MTPAPYERLYNDIEEGLPLTGNNNSSSDHLAGPSSPTFPPSYRQHDQPGYLSRVVENLSKFRHAPSSYLSTYYIPLTASHQQRLPSLPTKPTSPSSWRRPLISLFVVSSTLIVLIWIVGIPDSFSRISESPSSSLSSENSSTPYYNTPLSPNLIPLPETSIVTWPSVPSSDSDSSIYPVHYTLIPFIPPSQQNQYSLPPPHSPPRFSLQTLPSSILPYLLNPSTLLSSSSSYFSTPSLSRSKSLPKAVKSYFFEKLNEPKFDVVWTWVNGSDPLHADALSEAEKTGLIHKKRVARRRLLGLDNEKHVEARLERYPLEMSEEEDEDTPSAAELELATIERRATSAKLYRYVHLPESLINLFFLFLSGGGY